MRGKLFRIFPFAVTLICLAGIFLTVGCGSSKARYRFIQAATAIPTNVDLQVDGKIVQSAVGYGQPATYHSGSSGSRKFVIFPSGTTTNPYVSESVNLGGKDNTLIMQNTGSGNVLSAYTDDNTAPTTGNVKLRIIHSAFTAQAIDVYIVPTGNGIAGVNPQISNLTFQGTSNYLSFSPATYDVIMTVAGTQNVLNRLTGTYPLTDGQIRTIVVLDASTGGGPYEQLQLNDLK